MDEKNLDNENIDVTYLYESINKMKNDLKNINKNSKKSIMSIESLKEEINKNSEKNFKLKKELEEKRFNEIKIYKKIIIILDLIDKICDAAINLEDEEFINDWEVIKKVIKKEINEINLMEIKSLGELFNPELHKCLAVEKNKSKVENQIISVVEKGYMLNGRVIRPASVIIVK